ncbi:hypothetical protein RND81_11G161100 [Saponaria officinalis]|uniref:Peptidase A1 domain-containing protein n=1 Tax=Saponaria officinalis TaxID=3572 RepID=A0AAW1HMV6_SAPOF
MSRARVTSLARSYVPKNGSVQLLNPNKNTIIPSIIRQEWLFLVQVGIGTFEDESPPSKTYYLELDTGSDVIWTQCEGCENKCFHQVDPYYPASRSSTYQPFSCSRDSDCPFHTKCMDNKLCRLEIPYQDGSRVLAIAAKEDFTFATEGGSQRIEGLKFGCGFDMQNYDHGDNPDNKISGVMGMSYGSYSIMKQTRSMFNGNFSYCIQPILGEGESSPMYLRFGNDVLPQRIEGFQATIMFRYKRRPAYYLNLQGISVDTFRLNILPSAFAFKPDGGGGCLIDSGAAFSYIVTRPYQVLLAAVKGYIKANNKNMRLVKNNNEDIGFDVCYERYKNPVKITLPKITFHFANNADYVIDVKESFAHVTTSTGKKMVCLGIFEGSSKKKYPNILGAYQQANKRIIYDRNNGLLHFASTDCSRDN